MFDVSFSELLVVAVVALIVIGPEKLPKVARTLGAISGRMQRYIAQVKEEVNRETRFEELQQLQSEIKASAYVAEQKVQRTLSEVQASVALTSEGNANADAQILASPTEKVRPVRKRRAKQSTVAEAHLAEEKVTEKPIKKRAKKPA